MIISFDCFGREADCVALSIWALVVIAFFGLVSIVWLPAMCWFVVSWSDWLDEIFSCVWALDRLPRPSAPNESVTFGDFAPLAEIHQIDSLDTQTFQRLVLVLGFWFA